MKRLNILPETGFVRLPEVLKRIPVSKSTLWSGIKTGRFPAPVKLGPRITAWRAEDIHAYIAESAGPNNALNSKGGDVSWK
jgi:predicted DNA-binding transcriptional regulator AlpA